MTTPDPYTLVPVDPSKFNPDAVLPFRLTVEHIQKAMEEYIDFLQFINAQLHTRDLERLESFLMPANFSSIVGEFMNSSIPKYCPTIMRNLYHNGHPDLIPTDMFPGNSILHGDKGIEIKASRHKNGWQGHNAEASWLMVFVFDSNTSNDLAKGIADKPFKFVKVLGAQLELTDWTFSGRSETSRRTITASINKSGSEKMHANWIYKDL